MNFNKPRYMQYFAASIAALSAASAAMHFAWVIPVLLELTEGNTKIANKTETWIAASFIFGGLLGCFVAGFVVEKFGRRGTLLFSGVVLFVPWYAIFFGEESVAVLITARTIAGIGGGLTMTAVPIYHGEIAEKDIRGRLGVSTNLLMVIGSLLVLNVGKSVSYKVLTVVCSIFPLLFFILFYFMPESPYYLIKKGRKVAARHSLVKLSCEGAIERTIDEHFKEIENTVENDIRNKSTVCELFSKENKKPFGIMIALKTFQQWSGAALYTSAARSVIIGPSVSISIIILFCGAQILGALISGALVDKMGRRTLLLISTFGSALTILAGLATTLIGLPWLALITIALYLLLNHMGMSSLQYVLLGELFTTNIKGIAVSLYMAYSVAFPIFSLIIFVVLVNLWGPIVITVFYFIFCILGGLIIWGGLPETKGKSFAEIQDILNGRKTGRVIPYNDSNNLNVTM